MTTRAPTKSNPSPRWAFMKRHDIPDLQNPGNTYLRRWRIIQTPWFGVFLHRIYLNDNDREVHDHPWNFTTITDDGWVHWQTFIAQRYPGSTS